jgi:hypothetical protein
MSPTANSSSLLDTEISGSVRQVINQHLTVKWMYQRHIVVYSVTGPLAMRDVAYTWQQAVKQTLGEWPADRPYLAIHDGTHADFTMSPYLQSTIREMFNLRPDLLRHIAVVTPNTLATQLLGALLRTSKRPNLRCQIFSRREDAVRWLLPTASAAMTRH